MLATIEKVQEEISKKYRIPKNYRDDIMQDIALIITQNGPNDIDVESIMHDLINKYSSSRSVFKRVRHSSPTMEFNICLSFLTLTIHEEFIIRMKYGFNINGIIYHNAYIAHCLNCSVHDVEDYEQSALLKLRENPLLLDYFQSLHK